jgi:hypothetical protein
MHNGEEVVSVYVCHISHFKALKRFEESINEMSSAM